MILLRRVFIAVLAGAALLLFYLWLTLLSPFIYESPEHLPPVAEGPHQVFVYGTLRYGLVRWLAFDRWADPEEAILTGYRREGLDLENAPNAQVEGLLLTLSAEELRKLDRYERLGIRYQRVKAELKNGESVWTYRRLETEAE